MVKGFGINLRLIIATALVGIGVALTYYVFEHAVHFAIDLIWDDALNVADHWLLIWLICLILALIYFGAQHIFDMRSENHESHGLGDVPAPTVVNFIKLLSIGFLSLVAGATLGPEAVLVPACIVLGGYIGTKVVSSSHKSVPIYFGAAGFVALFAAFFNSFAIGLLALLLIKKELKTGLSPQLIILAAVTSASTVVTLWLIHNEPYAEAPNYDWGISFQGLLAIPILILAGYLVAYGLKYAFDVCRVVASSLRTKPWWLHALVAGSGLAMFYIIGGKLVWFTGNESILPMLGQAAGLGIWGLLWTLLIKLMVIGWSKTSGYRGGTIFPIIFVASILVAIVELYVTHIGYMYGIIAALVGVGLAERKVKILF